MAFRNPKSRRKSRRVAGLRKTGKAINDIAKVSPEVAVKMLMRTFVYPQRVLAEDAAADVLAAARSLRLPFGRTRLQAYRWGAGAGGPVVALFHDWERESGYFAPYVQGLLDKGCEVVALDAPASGHSGGKRLSLREYINAVHTLLASVGTVHAVVGHGMGASALVQALAQLPPGQRPVRAVAMGMNADSKEIFQRRLASLGVGELVRLKFWRRLGKDRAVPLSNYDNVQAVRRLGDVEALVVHDTSDARYPLHDAEALAEAWPGAELKTFEGFGHALEGIPVITRLLPFIGAKKQLALMEERAGAGYALAA